MTTLTITAIHAKEFAQSNVLKNKSNAKSNKLLLDVYKMISVFTKDSLTTVSHFAMDFAQWNARMMNYFAQIQICQTVANRLKIVFPSKKTIKATFAHNSNAHLNALRHTICV